ARIALINRRQKPGHLGHERTLSGNCEGLGYFRPRPYAHAIAPWAKMVGNCHYQVGFSLGKQRTVFALACRVVFSMQTRRKVHHILLEAEKMRRIVIVNTTNEMLRSRRQYRQPLLSRPRQKRLRRTGRQMP